MALLSMASATLEGSALEAAAPVSCSCPWAGQRPEPQNSPGLRLPSVPATTFPFLWLKVFISIAIIHKIEKDLA